MSLALTKTPKQSLPAPKKKVKKEERKEKKKKTLHVIATTMPSKKQ